MAQTPDKPEIDIKPRSRDVTDGLERTAARGMLRAVGMTDDDWGKPQIGVGSSWNEITPCNLSLDRLAKAVKEGVHEGGGYPLEFGTISVSDGISMGHEGMHFSLVSREIIADSVEYMVNAHCADAMVCISNCDKITPGMLMAALRINVPAVFVSGGPMEAGKVGMYVCGMTVYDYCHVGHARMMMAFDVIYRWLMASGYDVKYVRNITDIDDKIIKRAVENGETLSSLVTRFTKYMDEDTAALGILPPNVVPRATEYVPQMLSIIEKLEQKGLAYQTEDGDVNYAVRKFAGYGKLSGKSLDELQAGERVAVDGAKQDPLDFVLWKAGKENEPAEAKWDSK